MPKTSSVLRGTAWTLMSAMLFALTGAAAPPRNLDKAIEAQMELHRQHPDDPKVANDLGNLLLLARRSDEAEIAYGRAIEVAPQDPVPLYNLGLLRQQQGRLKQALETFRKVTELDPGNAWAHYQLGALYEAVDEKQRAIRSYGRAFTINPELASSRVNPQVIESRWVVQALLESYRKVPQAQPLAPQAYDDPSRIAMLMISSPETQQILAERLGPGEAAAAGAEGTEGEVAESREAGAGQGTPRARLDEDEEEAASSDSAPSSGASQSARRVLTPETIERGGTLGEVNPSSGGFGSRQGSATSRRTTTRSGTPTIANPRSFGIDDSRTRAGRVRYQGSIRSTGSLDLDLIPAPGRLPVPESEAPAAPAG